jgi:hypothetical protein
MIGRFRRKLRTKMVSYRVWRPTKCPPDRILLFETRTIVCLPFGRKQTTPTRGFRKPSLRGQLTVVYDAAHLERSRPFRKMKSV